MIEIQDLQELQLDALREVASIGAGHAATALSQMTASRIMISVPRLQIARLGLARLEHGQGDPEAALERLPCDVLITPHPGASNLWERLAARDRGEAGALGDGQGCRRYAAAAREALARRLEREAAERQAPR